MASRQVSDDVIETPNLPLYDVALASARQPGSSHAQTLVQLDERLDVEGQVRTDRGQRR
jgi:hypothetical protein